jgi:site-specific recombinase XerD
MIEVEKLTKNYLEFCKYQKNLNPKSLKAYKIDLFISLDVAGKKLVQQLWITMYY